MRARLSSLFLLLTLIVHSSASAREFRIGHYRAIALLGEPRLLPDVQYVSFAGDYGFSRRLPSTEAIERHVVQESALLANFQLRVINLEAMLPGSSGLKKDRQIDGVAIDIPKKTGYDVISRANNHATDFGRKGVDYNTRLLQEAGFKMIGTRSFPVYKWETGGRKIAIFALTDYTDRPDPEHLILKIDEPDLRLIKREVSNADFRIAFVHLGSLSFYPSSHERTQVKRILDAGTDLVICTGSHFTKGFVYENGKPVFYGIGNHIFYGMGGDTEPVGMHVLAGLKKGELMQLFIVPFYNTIFSGKTGPLDEIDFASFQSTLLDRSTTDPNKYYTDPSSMTKLQERFNQFRFTRVTEMRGRHVIYAAAIVYHNYPVIVVGSGFLALASGVLTARWIVLRHKIRKTKEYRKN